MCQSCWEEYGSPTIDTPQVREMASRLEAEDPFGRFHIVVSDFNIEDEDIIFCRDDVPRHYPATTEDQMTLANDLLAMSLEERAAALALADGYWSIAAE